MRAKGQGGIEHGSGAIDDCISHRGAEIAEKRFYCLNNLQQLGYPDQCHLCGISIQH